MTPREPDRYEAKAREVTLACRHVGTAEVCNSCVAAALRAVEAETLERAAQALDSHRYINASKIVRALASPAAAPAAEKVTPELLAAHAADLAAGRHDLNGAYGCSICGTSPSEPAAPAPDLLEMLREAFSIVSLQAARNPVRFNIDLRDRMAAALATPASAQGAEARIAELEKERDHWRGACIEAMVTGKYPVSPHDDDPQIKSLREAAEASFHGQAYAEKARQLREAEALLRECEKVIRKNGHPRTCWYWRYDGMADDRRDINMRGDCDCGVDALLKKLAARAAPAKREWT